MNRTIVCKSCDNNRVIIKKVGQELFFKCSSCENTIMQAVHLESWNKKAYNTYKLRINIDDNSLFEVDICDVETRKKEFQTSSMDETKIRFMYNKEYGYIRHLEEDE
jgi:hypothetical protein